ncbi:hypothetical protein DUNSADRAFT_7179 [Dunaliella salina]|uniref:Uncharacterized protein n=1 Tax=Dunaliella salina TaxID=3046 RepID=A0ABQ7GLU0_DUNSA|nr:hypothetical protein DUNSADRAFT_7179 [Dunaliella salina]|eukprot:KAF5835577.1 hypothetical protein DUNSADRAFT_7179 [Dunaliella salina]
MSPRNDRLHISGTSSMALGLAFRGELAADGGLNDQEEEWGGSTSSLAGLLGGSIHDVPMEPGDSSPALTTFDSGRGEPPHAKQVSSSTKRQRTMEQADHSDRPAARDPSARRHAASTQGDSRWEQEGQQGMGLQQPYLGDGSHANNALDQDDMIDDRTVDEEQQPAEEGEGTPQPPPPPMTTTTANGILMMDDRLNSIEYKIREMTSMGVQRLDQIKAAFMEEMERFIRDLQSIRDSQHSRWSALAAETLQESQRLEMAKALMSRLGLDATAHDGGQQE